MSTRENVLSSIRSNQPELTPLPEINIPQSYENLVEKFTAIATGIGSSVYEINSINDIKAIIADRFNLSLRIISSFSELSDIAETNISQLDPHTLEDVEVAILQADFAVAENAAFWVPENNSLQRVLPFIAQHLVMVVSKDALVPTMHQAYEKISDSDYGYGVFIAGPSKTADIEQSLVLGAHGPRSMTVFILK